MKTITKTIILLSFLTLSFAILPTKSIAQHASVSFQLFYDNLSPYGQWIDDPEYGYAWIPDVDYNFVPYSSEGHWAYTVYGWTWVSYYDWGWAPFHYGRWGYNDYYGWFWVPGHEWGPSWVVWRRAEGYYGWAPMGPGLSINVTFGRDYHIPHHHWVFVRERDITCHHIHKHHLDRSRNVTIINQTVIINNTYEDHHRRVTYVYGPNRDEVQRATGRSVRSYAIYDYDKPGANVRGSKIRIYRPEVERGQASGHRVAVPARVVNSRDYRRPSDRATNEQRSLNTRESREPVRHGNNTRERQQRTEQNQNNNVERSSGTRTERQQGNVSRPENETQRATQQNSNQSGSRDRQQRTESQSNTNVERSSQQQDTNQPDNRRPERQTRVNESSGSRRQSTQQNANRSENTERQTRTVNRSSNEGQQATQQRNTNQSSVNREERQTNRSSSSVQRSSQQSSQSDNKNEQQSRSVKSTEREKRTESTSRSRR